MLETIEGAFNSLKALSSESPVIAGALSLYGLGVLTYLMRGVPQTLWRFIKRHTTTSLTITSSHLAFHNFMGWLYKEGYSNRLRNIKLTNGRWGGDDGTTKGAGYGPHVVWYSKNPLLITLVKEDTRSEYDKETLTITKLGRGHGLFDRIVKQFAQVDDTTNKVVVYTFTDEYWSMQQRQHKRDLNSVFIDQDKKEKLLRVLDNFKTSEEWYIEHGIPYRLGILLFGPPGTGKTSLIKSIAAYVEKNLCILSASKLSKLLRAAEKLPENSLMVIEDIDSNLSTRKRASIFDEPKKKKEDEDNPLNKYKVEAPSTGPSDEMMFDIEMMLSMADGGLSEILNAIDGISDTHGRVLVLTTNNPKQLDPALLRPGRVDLMLELGYVTKAIFKEFMAAFFPDFNVSSNLEVKEEVTISKLQQCVLMKESPEYICGKFLQRPHLQRVVEN